MSQPIKFQFTKEHLREALDQMIKAGDVDINAVEKHFGSPDSLLNDLDDILYEMGSDDLVEYLQEYAKATIENMVDIAEDDE